MMKKQRRWIAAWLACMLLVGTLSGCSMFGAKEKTFSKAGMSITLTSDFEEKELESLTVYYESSNAIVAVLKEEFTLFDSLDLAAEDLTLNDYADLVLANNGLNAEIKEANGLVYFNYEKDANGKSNTYLATVYKADDAFWLIQYCCPTDDYQKMEPGFIEWAQTVTFA